MKGLPEPVEFLLLCEAREGPNLARVRPKPNSCNPLAKQEKIATKHTRQAADEPTLEPSFDPLVNMTRDAPKNDRNLESLGPMTAGGAERVKRERRSPNTGVQASTCSLPCNRHHGFFPSWIRNPKLSQERLTSLIQACRVVEVDSCQRSS